MTNDATSNRRKRTGIVATISGKDTVKVLVKSRISHPKYKKIINTTQSFLVHDLGNAAKPGDKVEIEDTRPISKLKKWRITRIIDRAQTIESEQTK